ncbi:hypothetical protein [Bradyrhizobium sp.]|nr:hypothetical protein [Bradyrhizobium sp.]
MMRSAGVFVLAFVASAIAGLLVLHICLLRRTEPRENPLHIHS